MGVQFRSLRYSYRTVLVLRGFIPRSFLYSLPSVIRSPSPLRLVSNFRFLHRSLFLYRLLSGYFRSRLYFFLHLGRVLVRNSYYRGIRVRSMPVLRRVLVSRVYMLPGIGFLFL